MVPETSNKSLEQIAALFGDELHEETALEGRVGSISVDGKEDVKEHLRV
jgi:hypothetical protein